MIEALVQLLSALTISLLSVFLIVLNICFYRDSLPSMVGRSSGPPPAKRRRALSAQEQERIVEEVSLLYVANLAI